MDKKGKYHSEFEEILKNEGIDIERALVEKNIIKNKDPKKEFKSIIPDINEFENNTDKLSAEFVNDGVQLSILGKLRKLNHNFKNNETLDLHGYNQKKAIILINKFLKENYENNSKYLKIITGKGKEDSVNPIRKMTIILLKKFFFVKAFCHAKKDGGAGVILVKIKN